MAEWLESCEELLAMRPGIEATLASLREQALPWDAARQGEFAAREPDAFAEWELRSNVLRSLEHAQAIRSGAAAPSEVALSPEQRELDAQTLNAMAWARVAPEPLERELWGEEAFGLALAKLAVDKAPEAAARFEYLDTLACAWLANGEDDQAVRDTDPGAMADLSLSKTVGDPTPLVGSSVIFTLTVNNAGPNDATGIEVVDLLPGGYRYVGDDGGGSYAAESGVWTVGDVASGSSASLNITARVRSFGDHTNTAEIVAVNENEVDSSLVNS